MICGSWTLRMQVAVMRVSASSSILKIANASPTPQHLSGSVVRHKTELREPRNYLCWKSLVTKSIDDYRLDLALDESPRCIAHELLIVGQEPLEFQIIDPAISFHISYDARR